MTRRRRISYQANYAADTRFPIIQRLPDDLLVKVLLMLEAPTLVSLSEVSKRLCSFSRSDIIWDTALSNYLRPLLDNYETRRAAAIYDLNKDAILRLDSFIKHHCDANTDTVSLRDPLLACSKKILGAHSNYSHGVQEIAYAVKQDFITINQIAQSLGITISDWHSIRSQLKEKKKFLNLTDNPISPLLLNHTIGTENYIPIEATHSRLTPSSIYGRMVQTYNTQTQNDIIPDFTTLSPLQLILWHSWIKKISHYTDQQIETLRETLNQVSKHPKKTSAKRTKNAFATLIPKEYMLVEPTLPYTLSLYGNLLEHAPTRMKKLPSIVQVACDNDIQAFKFAAAPATENRELLQKLIKRSRGQVDFFASISKDIIAQNPDLAELAVKYKAGNIAHLHDSLPNKQAIINSAIKKQLKSIQFTEYHYQQKPVILESIKAYTHQERRSRRLFDAYQHLSNQLKADADVIIAITNNQDIAEFYLPQCIRDNVSTLLAIADATHTYKNKKEILSQASRSLYETAAYNIERARRDPSYLSSWDFKHLTQKGKALYNQRELILTTLIKENSDYLKHIPSEFHSNAIVEHAVINNPKTLKYASPNITSSTIFLTHCISTCPELFTVICELAQQQSSGIDEIKVNALAIKVVKRNALSLQYIPSKYRTKKIVDLAISSQHDAIQFCEESDSLDKFILLSCLIENPSLWLFAKDIKSPSLCLPQLASGKISEPSCYEHDLQSITLFITRGADIYRYLPEQLRAKRELWILALQKNAANFSYLSSHDQVQHESLCIAAEHNSDSLPYMPVAAVKDLDICLHAINHNPLSLRFMDKSIQSNGQFVMKCITKNALAIEFADDKIKDDPTFIKVAIERKPEAFTCLNDSVKNHLPTVQQLLAQGYRILPYICTELQQTIIIAGIQRSSAQSLVAKAAFTVTPDSRVLLDVTPALNIAFFQQANASGGSLSSQHLPGPG